MSKHGSYRHIHTVFWASAYVESLDPLEKLFYLYLIFAPLSNMEGVYKTTIRRIAFETGVDQDMVVKIARRFEKDGKAGIYEDGSSAWVVVCNASDHVNNWSPNIIKGYQKTLESIPANVHRYMQKIGYEYPEMVDFDPKEGATKGLQEASSSQEAADHTNTNTYTYTYTREAAVSYLNQKTGKSFKPNSDKTKRHIDARLRESYTLEDLKHVIDVKCEEWIGDAKMEPFLRPETLFGSKFESYLNQRPRNKPKPLVPSCPSCKSHEYYGGVCKACGYVEGAA